MAEDSIMTTEEEEDFEPTEKDIAYAALVLGSVPYDLDRDIVRSTCSDKLGDKK